MPLIAAYKAFIKAAIYIAFLIMNWIKLYYFSSEKFKKRFA